MVAVALLAERKLFNLNSSWAYDLAFFHNLLHNTLQGAWFVQTSSPHEAPGLFQLHHTYPILLVVLPLYAVWQKVTTLLWLQVAAVASSSIPAARLARRAGATPGEAAALGLALLVGAPVVMTALCDFRPVVLSIPLLLWCMVMVVEDRRWGTPLLVAATLAVREDMVYLLVALGLAMAALPVLGKRRFRAAAVLCGLPITYWLVMKAAGGELTYYFDPSQLGNPTIEASPLSMGQKVRFLLPYLLPLGLAAPLALPLLAPAALVGGYLLFVSPYEWADWAGVYGHHAAPLIASVAGATVVGWPWLLKRLRSWKRPALLIGLLAAQLALSCVLLPGWLKRDTGIRFDCEAAEIEAVRDWVASLPADAAVASDYATMGLVSGRRAQYATSDFRMTEDERFPWSGPDFPPGFEDVDVLLFDAGEDPGLEAVAVTCGAFKLSASAGDYRLYERVAPGGESCSDRLR